MRHACETRALFATEVHFKLGSRVADFKRVKYFVPTVVCAMAVLVIADANVPVAASQRDWDLSGRTLVGGRTAADVVVWLDAPGAPRRPQPLKGRTPQGSGSRRTLHGSG